MTVGTDDAKRAFRPWLTDGVPATGAHEPDKTEIRAAFDSIGLDIVAAGSGGDPEAVRAVIEPIRDDALAAADEAATSAAAINEKLSTVSPRSGYIGGWWSPSGLLGMGFRSSDMAPIFGNGGDLVARIGAVEASAPTTRAQGRSGYIGGIVLPDGELPVAVRSLDGVVEVNGRAVVPELDRLAGLIATGGAGAAIPDYPSDDLLCLGTSLTAAGSSGNWFSKLAALRGVGYVNLGVGGQGGGRIAARGNAVPVRFTAAFTLPADTAAVAVSCTYYSPVVVPTTGTNSYNITVLGVNCVLTRATDGSHNLARSAAGTATVAVPAGTQGLTVAAAAARGSTFILENIRNSLPFGGFPMGISQLLSATRAQINYQDARVKRGIIWGSPAAANAATSEAIGTERGLQIKAYNDAYAAAFPEYYCDIPGWLRTTAPVTISGVVVNDPFTVLGMTPTSQDLTDISQGFTPERFNASSSDRLHFSEDGGTAIAYRMNMEFKLRGSI